MVITGIKLTATMGCLLGLLLIADARPAAPVLEASNLNEVSSSAEENVSSPTFQADAVSIMACRLIKSPFGSIQCVECLLSTPLGIRAKTHC
ncbi:hypothetical protein RvY_04443 [Ramazzottius varieornatus]|uniref:Uncharacterized protein n=1 Tax=Ramazzottius varieornatus TaxID=947166 RepID=A0A1D1UV10_RAMVA|nr:hypothetical protein RvY_04443 [Ramazzottius varieornatus]